MYILVNGACHLNGKAHYCYCSYLLFFFFFHFYFGALLLPQFLSQSHEWGVKTCGLIGIVCYDFYKRSGVRCLPQGQNRGKKKRIDLTLRKTLTSRSSESGFHRNVKFATFEEAGRLCKTIPQNGVKVAPLGGRSVPKLPHWLSMVENFDAS